MNIQTSQTNIQNEKLIPFSSTNQKNNFFIILLFLLTPFLGYAQTWTGATSAAWDVGTNWSTGSAPDGTADVTIPNVGFSPEIPTGVDALAKSVVLNGGATLTINGTLTISESLGVGLSISPNAILTNNGTIWVGNYKGTDFNIGISAIYNNGSLINNAGAIITIDNTHRTGFINDFGTSNFHNKACAKINLMNGYIDLGTTINDGYFSFNSSKVLSLFGGTGQFTNNGLLEYALNELIDPITNNGIIIKPDVTTNCNLSLPMSMSNVFTISNSNNLTIDGIFLDAGANQSAGVFDQSTNMFTPSPGIQATEFFVKITDSGNNCFSIVPWVLQTSCNPDVGQPCPLRVIMVLDGSGSIGNNNAQLVISAVITYMNAIKDTEAELALIEFASGASHAVINGSIAMQPVDANFISAATTWLNNDYYTGGATYWTDAFGLVNDINNLGTTADLVIFFTDGNPQSSIGHPAVSDIGAINSIKTAGSHIFMIGVGIGVDEQNLIDASGPDNANNFPFSEADYTIEPNFAALSTCFAAIADAFKTTYYLDEDGDGYGTDATAVSTCTAPTAAYVTLGGDCDDDNDSKFPNNTEVCDGIDNNCDGNIDEGVGDGDGNCTCSNAIDCINNLIVKVESLGLSGTSESLLKRILLMAKDRVQKNSNVGATNLMNRFKLLVDIHVTTMADATSLKADADNIIGFL